jgi:hypothetical protein
MSRRTAFAVSVVVSSVCFGVATAAEAAAVIAQGVGGKIVLSQTHLASDSSFFVDQSAATNAGLALRLDLGDAPAGWRCAYTCPLGACDAMTYAALRTRTAPAEPGVFGMTCTASAFQTLAVPFWAAGAAEKSGDLTFERATTPLFFVYGVSLLAFGVAAGLSLYAITFI